MKKPPAFLILKKNSRKRVSKLKKLVFNTSSSASWPIREHNKRKLRLYKIDVGKYSKNRTLVRTNRRVTFYSPVSINYYDKLEYETMNKFLDEVRDCISQGRRVFINFQNTKLISASAMLSFLAEVDVLIKKSPFGTNAISFSHPKEKKIESILVQVGFYDLLKKEKRETENFDDVTFWKYTSGNCSEPMLAKTMMTEIRKELAQKSSKKLYRGFTEAMSNSVEHAYIDDELHSEVDDTAKWWTFAGIKDKHLIVVICDKGVGIPKTLPKTQGVSALRSIISKFGYSLDNVKDSIFIKASTDLQNTRTGETYRGKGLKDIKSVIDSIGTGYMGIFSNRGRYVYLGKTGKIEEIVFDCRTSVRGTIVEWSIPCEAEPYEDESDKSS